MNFACLTTVAPGADLAAQCGAIAAAGCTGIETIVFPDTPLEAWMQAVQQATTDHDLRTAVVILGGLALYRPGQTAWIGEALAAIGELDAAALITPEYRAQNPLPLFPPFPQAPAAEQACVAEEVAALVDRATSAGVTVLLEPVTQFEGRFWRTVDDVLQVCHGLAHQSTDRRHGVAIDFHNMNVTEADPIVAIERAGGWIKHVHLADNNRLAPGSGHIDFHAGLQALRRVGYDGWYSFECAVDEAFAPAMRTVIERLRRLGQSELG